MTNTEKTVKALQSTQGRFFTLNWKKSGGVERICARNPRVTSKSVSFYDQNAGKVRVAPLANVSVVTSK